MQAKFIEGFNNMYSIDKNGTVLSYQNGCKIIKSHLNNKGYLKVRLQNNSKDKTITIHRLIALHFIPNPENKKTVNHKDGNKLNNSIENLEWATQGEQISHAYKLKLRDSSGSKNPNTRFTEDDIIKMRSGAYSNKELVSMYKCRLSTLLNILNYKNWKNINSQ